MGRGIYFDQRRLLCTVSIMLFPYLAPRSTLFPVFYRRPDTGAAKVQYLSNQLTVDVRIYIALEIPEVLIQSI